MVNRINHNDPPFLEPRISDRKPGPYQVVAVTKAGPGKPLVKEPYEFVVALSDQGFKSVTETMSERTARVWAAAYSTSDPATFEVTAADGSVIAVFRRGVHIL